LLALFNLHGVFHSFLFLAAGALLMVNILICSLDRWKNVWRVVSGGPVKLPDDFYSGSTNRAQLTNLAAAPADAIGKSTAILKSHSYRVRTESIQEKVYLSADKNRLYRLGTYLSHLSLILFILAYIIGSYFGFRDTNFSVAEGATREVGNGTGLSLRLESFTDEYYPDGSPSDFRSEVILYKDGSEVERGTLQVNHPMSYEGTRFFQSFFGPAEVIQVRDSTGKTVYDGAVAMTGSLESGALRRYTGSFVLPDVGLKVQLISPAVNATDP